MSAKPARHLALVDTNTGEVVESRELADLQAKVEELGTKFKMAQRDVAAKNLRIANLEADHARRRMEHERYKDACRVAKYWWRKCRAADSRTHYLAPARLDAVLALMDQKELVPVEGKKRRQWQPKYTMADFKMAIDGAHFDHYVSKRRNGTDQHHDDLELICRSAAKFEEFIARAPYPREVAEAALLRDNPERVPTRPRDPAATAEVRVHDLGSQGLGFSPPLQAGRAHLRGCVGGCVPSQPSAA